MSDRGALLDEHALELAHLPDPALALRCRDQPEHRRGHDVLVVRPVERADRAPRRQLGVDAPQVVVLELGVCRRLERRDVDAQRVQAGEHAADRAVLAGCVHALEDEQHRAARVRRTAAPAARRAARRTPARRVFARSLSKPSRSAGSRCREVRGLPGLDTQALQHSAKLPFDGADRRRPPPDPRPHAGGPPRAAHRPGLLLARVSQRLREARVRREPGRSSADVAMPDGPAYFTSRGSLLGQVEPHVVAAAFGVFKPARCRRRRSPRLEHHRRVHDLRCRAARAPSPSWSG